jgi:ATP-dependent DNA helicase RecG
VRIFDLHGVGPRTAELLKKINIHTVQDLLFHLPVRYQDRTQITPLSQIRADQYVAIEGVITLAEIKNTKRRSLLCQLQDDSGKITLRFFYFNSAQQKTLMNIGAKLRCYGEAHWVGKNLEIVHPEYHAISPDQVFPIETYLTPIYPTTEGLHQSLLRKLTSQALITLQENQTLTEYLPDSLRQQFQLPDLKATLCLIHQPPKHTHLLLEEMHPARHRLAFEELLAHQLSLYRFRLDIKQLQAPALIKKNIFIEKLLAQLPFELTQAQQRVAAEISADLCKSNPMLRLLQGDVGAGKTVVAALAALQAVDNNYQVAFMAPTELLAEQHFLCFQNWLESLGVRVVFLAGKITGQARRDILQTINNGQAQIIIGTHALFQHDVEFFNLALIIVDEQHRFGVAQRLALRAKGAAGACPHQLMMTATPIPRTLSMTAYADLDCSLLNELPKGRMPITTVVISNQRRLEVIERVRQHCQQKNQVYWVCALIEESELLECEAAEKMAQQLAQILPEFRVALIHGRLKAEEKEQIMFNFKQHQLDLLVATTVIEVGVDVPNASLMIIENAERLGLAQLHQLRGRVGRGSQQSHCVLLYQSPLSEIAKQRLAIMRETQDGFKIADCDLQLRGPGEILGTRQTGLMQFKIADLLRDKDLLDVMPDVVLFMQQFPDCVDALIQRWLGNKIDYSHA